jgi:hypothetical protein
MAAITTHCSSSSRKRANIAEALKVYANRVERMLRLGGQGNYQSADDTIGRMRRIREGVGEMPQHTAYLGDLVNRHRAKRNFMKLLTARDR